MAVTITTNSAPVFISAHEVEISATDGHITTLQRFNVMVNESAEANDEKVVEPIELTKNGN